MSTSVQNNSAKKHLSPAWNIAIFSALPVGVAGVVGAVTYGLSNGDSVTALHTAKISSITAGAFITGLEAVACTYFGFGEYAYSHSGEGEWYPVRQTEHQVSALKSAWAGVALSAAIHAAAGIYVANDESYPQSTQRSAQSVLNDQNNFAISAPQKAEVYKTTNGFLLSLA